MISEWKPQSNYYIILPKEALNEVIDEQLVDIVGYKKDKVWTLGATNGVCMHTKFIENDKVAINIQTCNPNFTDVELKDGTTINAFSTQSWIDSEDFDLAKYYFQTNEFLTQEEYDVLVDTNAIEIV